MNLLHRIYDSFNFWHRGLAPCVFFRLCRRSKVKRKLRLVLSIFSFFSFYYFLNLMKACWSETFIPQSAPGSQSDFTALNVLDSGAVVSLDSDVVFNDDRAKLVSGCSGFEEGNQLPKGIMRSAVPLPCFFDVVKSQEGSRAAAPTGDKVL